MKHILVTGGLGFMGYHLTKYLLNNFEDIEILIIDNLSSSKVEFGDQLHKLNVKIEDFKDCDVSQIDVDYIYHLASPVGSLGILKMNGYVAQEIISLTYKAIEVAEKCDAKLLCISSSEVYGRAGQHKETDDFYLKNELGTRSEYALGKLASEIIINNLAPTKKLRYNICRPFNVIGEQQSSLIGFVVPTFFENAVKNTPLPVFYDGKQRRSFCHVSDIVRAFTMIQESEVEGEVFNVGNGSNIVSIRELADMIIDISGSTSEIKHIDPVKIYGDNYIEAFDKVPDISKTTEMIGWKPELSLADSLNQVHQHYSSYENTAC